MRLETLPYDVPAEVHWGSDVESLMFSSRGLTVRVVREISMEGQANGLDISFSNASAFRYLDELDLARYWSSEGFVRGYPVLEVVSGGWCDEEAVLQQYENRRREWLVVTGNGCVSVLAPTEPAVEAVEWQRDTKLV
jgi:hypothetical protein